MLANILKAYDPSNYVHLVKLRENGLKLRDDHLQNINSLVIGGKISRTVGRSLIHLEIENGALVVKHEGKEDKSYLCATKRCANFPATLQTYCLTCIDAGQKPLPKLPDFLQNKIQNLNEPTQDSADNTPVMDDDDDFKPSTSKRKAKKPIPILKSAKVVKKDTKYTMKKASAILMETKVPAERMEPFLCENIVEPSPPRIKSPPRIPSPTRTPSPTITPSPTRTPSHTRTPSPQPTTSHPVPETIENLVRTPTTSSHGTTTFECPDANMDDASYSEYQHAGFSTPPLEIDLDERFTPPIPDSPSSVHFSPEPRCDLTVEEVKQIFEQEQISQSLKDYLKARNYRIFN